MIRRLAAWFGITPPAPNHPWTVTEHATRGLLTLTRLHRWTCHRCESATGDAPTPTLAHQAARTHWMSSHATEGHTT